VQAEPGIKWTWPFGIKELEAKAAWPVALLSESRAANWGARNAGALIRDGNLRDAVAYLCVRMVAEAAASIPLKTVHKGAGRLLRQTGPEMAPAGFLEAVFSELLLSGNALVEAVRLRGETDVAALFQVRSAGVRPVVDARGWLEASAVRGRNGQERMVRRSVRCRMGQSGCALQRSVLMAAQDHGFQSGPVHLTCSV
jgi:phage portal protein BeeE